MLTSKYLAAADPIMNEKANTILDKEKKIAMGSMPTVALWIKKIS